MGGWVSPSRNFVSLSLSVAWLQTLDQVPTVYRRESSPVAKRPGDEREPSGFPLIFLLKSYLHCVCVCSEAFHLRQANACIAEHLEVAAVEAQHARALHECMDTQRRSEPGRARGRQRVIRAGHVVAKRHRGVSPAENRSRVFNLSGAAACIGGDDEEVLRSEVVRELHRLVEALRHDDAAVGLADDLAAPHPPDETLELFFDAVAQRG